jgi:hypothetical protein
MYEWFQVENPQYRSARAYGRWYGHLPRYLAYHDDGSEGELLVPRGAREDVDALPCGFPPKGVSVNVSDLSKRVALSHVHI